MALLTKFFRLINRIVIVLDQKAVVVGVTAAGAIQKWIVLANIIIIGITCVLPSYRFFVLLF